MNKRKKEAALLKMLAAPKGVEELRQNLYSARAVLKQAAHDYAERALEHADSVFELAQSSAPCVTSYCDFAENRRCTEMAKNAMNSAMVVNHLIVGVEETQEADIDIANADHKTETLEFSKFAAILQSSHTKIDMASHAMPKKSTPGSRFDGSVYTKTTPTEGEDG